MRHTQRSRGVTLRRRVRALLSIYSEQEASARAHVRQVGEHVVEVGHRAAVLTAQVVAVAGVHAARAPLVLDVRRYAVDAERHDDESAGDEHRGRTQSAGNRRLRDESFLLESLTSDAPLLLAIFTVTAMLLGSASGHSASKPRLKSGA